MVVDRFSFHWIRWSVWTKVKSEANIKVHRDTVTIDNFDFWFMGILTYLETLKYLEQSKLSWVVKTTIKVEDTRVAQKQK